MKEKAEYRSSVRSREMIRRAFLELLAEKELDKITVTEISRRADLNRRTFYAHYSDVQAVMEEMEQEASKHISGFFMEIKDVKFWRDPLSLLEAVTAYLESDVTLYRVMLRASSSSGFVEKMQNVFVDYMLNLNEFPAELRNSQDYLNRAYFYAGGIANMYVSWFCGRLGGSLNDLAFTLSKLIMNDPLISDIE